MQVVNFGQADREAVCLDVRSPGEFGKGHIPGAVNLPLLDDQERAQVGTCYHQRGRNPAVILGLRLIGARLADLAQQGISACSPSGRALVYCWRGGERSASLGWLLEKVGLQVQQLRGGYKAYRRHARASLQRALPVRVLGGFTGSGKTEVLRLLRQRGQQVIDLEELAHHKGSAFGHLGQPEQPSSEMFENLLAQQWALQDSDRPVWLEDESHCVGSCYVSDSVWDQLRAAPLYFLRIPQSARRDYLIEEYVRGGMLESALVERALDKIQRRLGGENHRRALQALHCQDWPELVGVLLDYYDRAYAHGKSLRPPESVCEFSLPAVEPARAVDLLLEGS
jgi:tRNA 2-selenouridine synthase